MKKQTRKSGVKKNKERRLHWFGHLMRLQDETPAKHFPKECERTTRKPQHAQGRPKRTWLN